LLRAVGDAESAAVRAEGGSSGPWTLRAASVTGVRHRLAGARGEDSFAWSTSGPRLAVAVADGLGAVEGSAGAAARAVRAAVEGADWPEGSVREAVLAGVDAANRASTGGGATTLVLAVVDETGRGDVARVGDSSAFVVSEGGDAWVELFSATCDDAIDLVTEALPAEVPEVESAEIDLDEASVLVLVTDGIADPWRDGPTTVAPAITATLAGRPSATQLATFADFSRQGCHDDRTVVAVWRAASE
jgi:serine/threonine protein phosphatase PrpC